MTKEEYRKKIDELNEQIYALNVQIKQITQEFIQDSLRVLEEQGITPGTKVSVKTKTWNGDEIDIETYFFGAYNVYDNVQYVFHKSKKDGTMSQTNQPIEGKIISIHKI